MTVVDTVKDATGTVKEDVEPGSAAARTNANQSIAGMGSQSKVDGQIEKHGVVDSIEEAVQAAKEVVGLKEKRLHLRPATREEMSEARLPHAYRDGCANLLIPLNRCRFENYYLPWKCVDERHGYEKCQYEDFKIRVKKMEELKAARDAAKSS